MFERFRLHVSVFMYICCLSGYRLSNCISIITLMLMLYQANVFNSWNRWWPWKSVALATGQLHCRWRSDTDLTRCRWDAVSANWRLWLQSCKRAPTSNPIFCSRPSSDQDCSVVTDMARWILVSVLQELWNLILPSLHRLWYTGIHAVRHSVRDLPSII